MQQNTLWFDVILDAVGGCVQAAGGVKRVASKLWPTLSQSSAEARLRCCLNPDHAQKLDPDELLAIALLGREVGCFTIMEFMARELGCELKILPVAESKKRANRLRRMAILDELKRLEDEE